MITIAYNVFDFVGYVHRPEWARGKTAGKDSNAGAQEIGQALKAYAPDIITTSESHNEAAVAALANTLGFHHIYFPSPGLWPGGLITRYRIIESQNCPLLTVPRLDLFTRHWGRAILETDDGPLILHSVHTYASTGDVRYQEVKRILSVIEKDLATGHSILVQGDMNHTPGGPEYDLWIEAGLVDTFAQMNTDPQAGKTLLRPEPRARIDYIFVAGPLAKNLADARPLFDRDFRLYADQPDFVSLSDHLPQWARFEG